MKQLAQLTDRQRPLRQQCSSCIQQSFPVDASDLAAERAAGFKTPLEHRLEQRPQAQAVARGDEVDRAAVHRHAHGPPALDEARQLLVPESLEAGRQADVWKVGHLGLHGHEALDGRRSRGFGAAKQQLTRQQSAIQRAPAEDLGFAGHGPIVRSRLEAPLVG